MIYIVTGLPRSGTSLLMQIMKEGGRTIASDGERQADQHNPQGYFEVQGIMQKLKDTPSAIDDYNGMVLKLICYGLPALPPRDYKVIYIERDIREVLASMEKMDGNTITDETASALIQLNEKMKTYVKTRPDMKILWINHANLIQQDEPALHALQQFCDLQGDFGNVIDQNLYRNNKISKDIPRPGSLSNESQERLSLDKLKSLGYL